MKGERGDDEAFPKGDVVGTDLVHKWPTTCLNCIVVIRRVLLNVIMREKNITPDAITTITTIFALFKLQNQLYYEYQIYFKAKFVQK